MFPHFRARIAYGQDIRAEAAAFIAEHGSLAGAAAEARAGEAAGSGDIAQRVFREAVRLRVQRELGTARKPSDPRDAATGAGWFDLHLDRVG